MVLASSWRPYGHLQHPFNCAGLYISISPVYTVAISLGGFWMRQPRYEGRTVKRMGLPLLLYQNCSKNISSWIIMCVLTKLAWQHVESWSWLNSPQRKSYHLNRSQGSQDLLEACWNVAPSECQRRHSHKELAIHPTSHPANMEVVQQA